MYKTLFCVCLDVVDYVTKDDDMMCFFQSSQPCRTVDDACDLVVHVLLQAAAAGGWVANSHTGD